MTASDIVKNRNSTIVHSSNGRWTVTVECEGKTVIAGGESEEGACQLALEAESAIKTARRLAAHHEFEGAVVPGKAWN